MDSAVLTRSSKGNKSIFQAIKQTDTTTEYTLGADGCNKTNSLHRHFQRKKNSFLVLLSPLYWNTISHTKVAVASPQRLKLRVLDYFPLKFCFLKENRTLNESMHSMKSICIAQKFVIKKKSPKAKMFLMKRWSLSVDALRWDLVGFNFASSCTLFSPCI